MQWPGSESLGIALITSCEDVLRPLGVCRALAQQTTQLLQPCSGRLAQCEVEPRRKVSLFNVLNTLWAAVMILVGFSKGIGLASASGVYYVWFAPAF